MAGYMKIYVVGGEGGFLGADGVNPIEFMVLVGEGARQWLEPHYFDPAIKPIGRLGSIVPAAPDHPDALLDACIAFCPRHFARCPTLAAVESALQDAERLDFDLDPQGVPAEWAQLREEARSTFGELSIWQAEFQPLPAPIVRNR